MSEEFEEPPIIPPPAPEPPGAPDENVHFLHYDTATGAIAGIGHCPESALAVNSGLYPALGFMLAKADPATQLVNVATEPHTLEARPVFAITASKTTVTANGTDSATLSNIPANTTVTLLGTPDRAEVSEVVTGSTTVTTVIRGPHVFRFENYPYQTWELTIDGV
jgi:hypothetical protein